jgi:hypothetical protein
MILFFDFESGVPLVISRFEFGNLKKKTNRVLLLKEGQKVIFEVPEVRNSGDVFTK